MTTTRHQTPPSHSPTSRRNNKHLTRRPQSDNKHLTGGHTDRQAEAPDHCSYQFQLSRTNQSSRPDPFRRRGRVCVFTANLSDKKSPPLFFSPFSVFRGVIWPFMRDAHHFSDIALCSLAGLCCGCVTTCHDLLRINIALHTHTVRHLILQLVTQYGTHTQLTHSVRCFVHTCHTPLTHHTCTHTHTCTVVSDTSEVAS
jgi:hypothetical protein